LTLNKQEEQKMLTPISQWLRSVLKHGRRNRAEKKSKWGFVPEVEHLEIRVVPTDYAVTTLSATPIAGQTTFAQAITRFRDDNNRNLVNRIIFNADLNGTINLTEALPEINKNVQIIGNGRVTIARGANAAQAFSLLRVQAGARDVKITKLNFRGGQAGVDGRGGGIRATLVDSLTISNCNFEGCTADGRGGRGGAIEATEVHFVSIFNCQFGLNGAGIANDPNPGGFGGAISVDGDNATSALQITRSRFVTNTASSGGAVSSAVGTLTITSSTFSDNRALNGDGGAVLTQNNVLPNSALLIDASVFDQNRAPNGRGGAIANGVNQRTAATGLVRDCTLSRNTANAAGAISDVAGKLTQKGNNARQNSAMDNGRGTDPMAGMGGALLIDPNLAGANPLANNIIAGNTATNAGPDVYGAFSSLGHNLIGITDGGTGFDANLGDLLGTAANPLDPLLNPLGFYGGTTQTMTLQYNSPALDAGDNTQVTTATDQRGYTRIVNGTVDIGPVEMQAGEFNLTSPFAYNVDFTVALGDTLNVDGSNSTPTLLDYSGNSGNGNVTITAVNGQTTNLGTPITTAQGGSVTVNGNGTFTYTAPNNTVQDDSFTYTTYDSVANAYRTGTVTIHLTDITVFPADYSTLKSHALNVAADPQGLFHFVSAASGNNLTIADLNGNPGGSFTTNHGTVTLYADGSFTYTPTTGYVGDDKLTITVTDGIDSQPMTVNFHVVEVLANNTAYTTVHDQALSAPNMMGGTQGLLYYASGAEGQTLDVVAIDGDEDAIDTATPTEMGGTITAHANGSFTYTPPSGWIGDDWISYTVSDGTYESTATAVFHVIDHAPTVSNPYYTAHVGQTLNIPDMMAGMGLLWYASDSDGDTLSLAAINDDPANIGATITTEGGASLTVQSNGSFAYTPTAAGDDTFTFTITDGFLTTTATVTIHVT
jgi:hypothetical protein